MDLSAAVDTPDSLLSDSEGAMPPFICQINNMSTASVNRVIAAKTKRLKRECTLLASEPPGAVCSGKTEVLLGSSGISVTGATN